MNMLNGIGTPHYPSTSDGPGLTDDQEIAVEQEMRIWREVREIMQRARIALSLLPEPAGHYNSETPSALVAILNDYLPDLDRAERSTVSGVMEAQS